MAWSKRTDGPPRLHGRASQSRRARVLARNGGRCVRCNAPATIADHIVNLAVSGKDDRLVSDAEMQGLCGACHDAKTSRESRTNRVSRQRAPEPHPGEVVP
jgi:5-methylcytosine-specific restriction enzyme A